MAGLAKGMPGMLLALLLLFSRLIAPVAAMPAPVPHGIDALALQTICHGDGPGQTDPSDHRDCLLCPACHLVSQAVLPTPVASAPLPPSTDIAVAAPLPPATGPPSRVRATAQPTGPPRHSA